MSDDEFDIVDDLANLEGVDWDTLLSGLLPPPNFNNPQGLLTHELEPANRLLSSTSSDYSFDEMDQDAFAELDNLERNNTQSQTFPSPFTADSDTHGAPRSTPPCLSSPQLNSTTTAHISRSSPNLNGSPRQACGSVQTSMKRKIEDDLDSPARKKQRSEFSPLKPHLPSKKGKEKANEHLWQVLSEFEDEFTCPICCDIFVAAHLGNPCGHSFCGACGWQWSMTKNNGTCAICRTKLSKDMPMIPNIAMDNTVEKHIQALGASGNEDWILGGTKYMEWNFRKEKWKKDVAASAKKGTERGKKPKVMEVIDMDFLYFMVPDDDDDDDYEAEEGDVEADGSGASNLRRWDLRRRRTRV